MRDVRTAPSTATRYTFKQYEDGGVGPVTSTYDSVYTARSTGRGELLRSNHRVATPYSAYRYTWDSGEYLYFGARAYDLTYTPGQGYTYRYYRQAYAGRDPLSSNLSIVSASLLTSDVEKALTRTRNNLLNGISSSNVNIGTFFGELPESASMILSTGINVLRAYRACRRGNFAAIPKLLGVDKLRGILKTPAGVWFAYKFGWKPLVTDIYNMHSSIQKQLSKPSERRSSSTTTISPTRPSLPPGLVVGVDKVDVRCTVYHKVENAWVHNAQAFGLLNPLSVAWELLPMSFVIDWFLPIGGLINNLSATAGLEFAHGHEVRCASVRTDYISPPITGTTGTYPTSHHSGFSWTRDVLTTFPKPGLNISLGLNRNQVLTMLGLLTQRL